MFQITSTRTAVVYLAGGMKTGWQEILLETFPELVFIDPRNHTLKSEADFTRWDLTGVSISNIVFGFMEKTNPHGGGLATEFGYADGLSPKPNPAMANGTLMERSQEAERMASAKHVIYVEEPGFPHSRGLAMARSIAHSVHTTLEEGILELGAYVGLPVDRQLLRERIQIHEENKQLVARPPLVAVSQGARVGS